MPRKRITRREIAPLPVTGWHNRPPAKQTQTITRAPEFHNKRMIFPCVQGIDRKLSMGLRQCFCGLTTAHGVLIRMREDDAGSVIAACDVHRALARINLPNFLARHQKKEKP